MKRGFSKQTIYLTALLLIMIVSQFGIVVIQSSGVLFSTNTNQYSQQTNTNSHQLLVTTSLGTKDGLKVQKNSGTQNSITSQVNSRDSGQKGINKQTTIPTPSNQKTLSSKSKSISSQSVSQTQYASPASITATVSISQSPSPVDIGASVTISANTVGTAVNYYWTVSITGCPSSPTTQSFSCTAPSTAGTYSSISIIETDINDNIIASGSGSLTVVNKPTSASISASPSSGNIDAGQTVTFTASLTGGDGASSYTWNNLPTGCSGSTNPLSCTPTNSGTFSPSVKITDNSGNSVTSSSITYVVQSALSVSKPTGSPSSSTLDANNPATFTTSVSGGKTSYSYSWSGFPTGCSSANLASITCTPTVSGTYSIYVTVTDGNSNTVQSATLSYNIKPTLIVSVTASPPSSAIDLGQSTTFTATGSGGSGFYTSYSWTSVPTGCSAGSSNTFSCTPSSAGTFTVSATMTDSNGYSASNSLSYTVLSDPTISTPSASPSSGGIDIGQSTTFSTTASSGSGSYSYSWSGLPTGCTSSDTNSLSCTPSASGTFSVKVTATDSNGFSVTSSTLTYIVDSDPSVTTPSPAPASGGIDIGQTVTFSTTASNGAGSYSYSWSGLPTGCSTSNTNSLSCKPTASGTFTVTVTITDANGFSKTSSSLTYLVNSDPTSTTPSGSPASSGIDVGQSVTFSTTASGGSGGYSYAWYNLPTGCTTSNSNSFSCIPTASGTFNFYVNVTDSNGFTAKITSLGYTVLSDPTISTPSPSVVSGKLDAGNSVTFSVTASGGTGTYTYTWNGLPGGCSSTDANSITCTPNAAGISSVSVAIIDSNNFQVTGLSLSYTVLAKLAITTPTTVHTSSDVGQSVTFSTTASGGSTFYSYAWNGLPTGCSTTNSNSLTCNPSASGTFSISVVLTDSNNYQVTSGTFTFTIFNDPTISTPTSSIASGGLDVGQTVSFSTTASNGAGTYTFIWSGLPTGCSAINSSSLTCSPSVSGTFSISVAVTDSNSYQVTSGTLSYTILSDPSVGTLTANASSIDIGQSVAFTSAVPTGGLSPYSYTWIELPIGCIDTGLSSVSCTPTISGTFNVYVKVTDTNGYTVSSSVLVFSIIGPASIDSFTSNTTNIDLNQAIIFTVSVSNGAGSNSYSWNLPTGCTSTNSSTVTCTPSVTGSFTVNVTATDSNNFSVISNNTIIIVNSDPSAGAPNYSIPSGSLDVGQHVTFTSATPSGGVSPYTYSWNNLPAGCANSGTSTVSCTPTAGGTFNISVTITDANGYSSKSSNLTYLIYSLIVVNSPSTNVSSVDLGQSVEFTITASGGAGSYSYVYNGLPIGCSSLNAITIACTPTNAGSYVISVSVTDANYATVTSSSLSFIVYSLPTISTPTPSVTSISVGSTVVFSTTVSGGSGSFTYNWVASSNNLDCSASTSNTISCSPTASGSYTITVTVTDSNGESASATSNTITVNPAQQSSSSSTTTSSSSTTTSHTSTPNQSTNSSKQSPGFTTFFALIVLIISAGVLSFNRKRKNT